VKAYFIDGKTSKRRACEIAYSTESINISYVGDDDSGRVSTWQISDILKINVRTTHRALKHGDFPHEVLEFESLDDFDDFITQYPEASFHQSPYNKFAAFGWKGMVSATVGVVLVSLLFFFYGAPFLADTIARSIPNEYETYIGKSFRETYLQYLTVDSTKSEQIQKFYDHLDYESEYDVSVLVVESNMVNAFALPGGFIVVYGGIIDIMDDEHELAALLAHETAHINGRHSLRKMSKDLAMYLLLASLTGDIGGFSSVLIENSNMISSLSFSREFEKNADLVGLDLMIQSSLNPIGMVDLFKKFESSSDSIQNMLMQKLTRDTSFIDIEIDTSSVLDKFPWRKVTELLSTHPRPKNRINYLMKEIERTSQTTQIAVSDSLTFYFKALKGR
jgi:Zn-dependent protease with chaperone function